MIFKYPQVRKNTQALKDLIKINDDRIDEYQTVLNKAGSLSTSTREVFKSIIAEGILYRQQLTQKVKQLDNNLKTSVNIFGKIYLAWKDLKVTFACDTQRAIITNCLYNEEIALHAYRAALRKGTDISEHVLQLLGEHEAGLKKNYELLKCYKGMHHTADSSLMYFA